MITTRRHRSRKPHKESVVTECEVEFQSILRIRPLQKKEREDHVILEASKHKHQRGSVAVLHPMMNILSSPEAGRKSLESNSFLQDGETHEFRFDKVFDTQATQDTLHYAIGLSMASNAMDPLKKGHAIRVKNHLAISMGVTHGGKTYTTFGSSKSLGRPGKHAEDGLVPRILESLFSQSKHHVCSKSSFAIRMTLVHVEGDRVHDLLADAPATPGKKSSSSVKAMVASFEKTDHRKTDGVHIDQDPATHDYQADCTVKTCWNAAEARETLQSGLSRAMSSRFAVLGRAPPRGHTFITVQPVLIKGRRRDSSAVDKCGGMIAVLDMAGLERIKKGRGGGAAVKESVAINSSNAAIMHCLRTLKRNSEILSGQNCNDMDSLDGSDISNVSEPKTCSDQQGVKMVPYRQSKVTMLLQPILSNTALVNPEDVITKTMVTTIVAAYPGHRDYNEKRALLNDIDMIYGVNGMNRPMPTHQVSTGVKMESSRREASGRSTEETIAESEENGSLELSVDSGPPPPPFAPSAPSAPFNPTTVPISIDEHVPVAPPPAYNPSSYLSPHVSAPPFDEAVATDASAKSTASIRNETPSRQTIQDFPGVNLSARASAAVASHHASPAISKTPTRSHRTSRSIDTSRAPHHEAPSSAVASPLRAKISSSPNIQPPSSSRKKTPSQIVGQSSSIKPTPPDAENKSPSRNWMTDSPLKTISRAVHASKKKGQRAVEKIDKLVDRKGNEGRLTSEMFERQTAHGDTSKGALSRRVNELESENEKLVEANQLLEARCHRLEKDKKELELSLREAKRRWMQTNWTKQDEEDWQRSKKLRVEEQQLIRGPLKTHMQSVGATHEMSSQWMSAHKPPFSLQFPNHWTPAKVLNERDRSVPTPGGSGK